MRRLFLLSLWLFCLAPLCGFAAADPDCLYPVITYTDRLTPDNECGGHLLAGANGSVIEKHGYCRFLDNNAASDYFIPALSPIELTAFFNFLPAGVVLDRCIRPYSRTDAVSTDCGIPPADVHYADVLADNPTGCLMSGNMTSITHSAILTRWTSRAVLLSSLSEPPPAGSVTTLVRADTDLDGLTDRSTYTFSMQRADCRTAHNGERVCNYRHFSQFYVYSYSIPATPASEMGYVLTLSLSTSNNAPPFAAPGPLNCPPTHANGDLYEVAAGTQWRAATPTECPDGPGTRQCEQRVYNQYQCNDGLGDVTGSVRYEDTGVCIGACAPKPCTPSPAIYAYGSCVIHPDQISLGGESCIYPEGPPGVIHSCAGQRIAYWSNGCGTNWTVLEECPASPPGGDNIGTGGSDNGDAGPGGDGGSDGGGE